ncbi:MULTISPECIES: GNAT family N-acetyltransferase [Pantoea]|jgi:GNAT superfamily N-acetyltransferase|uniref:GNAT family N-acetyltransferase n=1 Tax=Pantoea brenneri TaxID=472694 RepID=A0A7Y6TQX8_9GAMM|nr:MULTISPECIES: GNAT family N-acetyltransferase [Pantoea]KKD34071.1 acetyltransferase [Pantoea sp. 3.5.1]MBZ6393840.1 GNAT family N-acetyltransferase [Pantoea sp.]MBZ6436782.1 GNAT family N-acetyltransferase [Pantoea sp.]MCQ5473111.1 GNAT family N-acetyltransferase [Pantoea brenneri]MDU4125565.1 GNAT family N-acetyltransferase [Pantoea sp.]
MQLDFRQVRADEITLYLALMHAAYAPVKALGIHFDAATADRDKALRHLQSHGVYALYADGVMVSSVTLRYPWGPLPGPFGLPHIGWFGAHPDYAGQHFGRQILHRLEQEILIGQLRAPAVSLGTALSHPWLQQLYLKRGFQPMHTTDLGKGHITLYMKKVLDEAAHHAWLSRQVPPQGNIA